MKTRKEIVKDVLQPKEGFGVVFHYYEDDVLIKKVHVLNGVTMSENKYKSIPKSSTIDFTENRLTNGKKTESNEK